MLMTVKALKLMIEYKCDKKISGIVDIQITYFWFYILFYL